MLQEAAKVLGSAFNESFIRKLSLYLHDCVREEVKSSTFRNLNQDKDNKWFFVPEEETLLFTPDKPLSLDGANSEITDLMIQSDVSQKDHYLIYGYLFLKGKNPTKGRQQEFLTPLLYSSCKLERAGLNINCTLVDDILSLNTGALAELLKSDDEERTEHLFEGLIDVVPELPLTKESVQIFLITLKSLFPQINIDLTQASSDNLFVCESSAVILTKRPSITAGILHELTQISEKPSGLFRETALNIIQEEFSGNKKNIIKNRLNEEEFHPIAPLELSESQNQVIAASTHYPLVSVYGPPGTGKSQTIVNLVSHLVASGKTVLVASRMDKAVDVVSERLNNLGAPFLCLRAGRANYQKQLNFQLQDLLANKIDLDSDIESSIFTHNDDIKGLFKKKHDIEKKCEKILELEENWSKVLQEYKKYTESSNTRISIEADLSESEAELYKRLLGKLNGFLSKSGFINNLAAKILFKYITKKLKLNNIALSKDSLTQIYSALIAKGLFEHLKSTESSINKTGNLYELFDNLGELREEHKSLSKRLLINTRRESLKGLLRDQSKRQSLYIHSKALVERKKNLQNRLLQDEDFSPLLEAFPCWAVTTYAISESLPLKPGLFDVAIIDEASQCDIASCFPVLFRAKSAIIVGDDKQLAHLSFLDKTKEQSFLNQYDIPDRYQIMWRFRTNSIFDVATFYSSQPVLLDEHFRSLPPIINFSNREFYGNRIKIINKELLTSNCIELNVVEDGKVDPDNTRNMAEVEKVLEKFQDIINNNQDNPVSIGIISPFRGQVELIKKAVSQVFTQDIVKKYQLEIGTAHTFQGDEKDIILLSFTLAPNSHHQSLTFVQKANLFNVAITRAKKQLICFISRDPKTLQPGLLKSYLEYIQEMDNKISHPEEKYNNSAEQEIAELCKEIGFTVIPNFESAGFNIDLAIFHEGSSIAVECSGFSSENSKNTAKKFSKKVLKHETLERCGWKIIHITAREWHYSKKVCIDKIVNSF